MKITFAPEDLHRRFIKELRSRQGATKHPANSVRLGVLLDNGRLTATLVNELPQLQPNQEKLKVDFEPSSSGKDIYMRVDLRHAAGYFETFKDEDGFDDVFAWGEMALYNVVRTKMGLYDKVPLHRLLVALHLETDLAALEVHHVNINQHDNAIENLLVTDKPTHVAAHALIDKDLEDLEKKNPSIYNSFKERIPLETLRKGFSNLHLVLTYKSPPSKYQRRGENTGEKMNRTGLTLGELMAMPLPGDLRDGSNLRRFQPPEGYAGNMALILQVLDELTPLRRQEPLKNGGWIRKGEILRLVQARKVGQKFSAETFERWLAALVTYRLIEPGRSEKTGKANGYYRLTWDAYTFPRA
jgi:hypothetical protein